jgi:hypothetical protein
MFRYPDASSNSCENAVPFDADADAGAERVYAASFTMPVEADLPHVNLVQHRAHNVSTVAA